MTWRIVIGITALAFRSVYASPPPNVNWPRVVPARIFQHPPSTVPLLDLRAGASPEDRTTFRSRLRRWIPRMEVRWQPRQGNGNGFLTRSRRLGSKILRFRGGQNDNHMSTGTDHPDIDFYYKDGDLYEDDERKLERLRKVAIGIQIGLLAYLGVEIAKVFRDVWREYKTKMFGENRSGMLISDEDTKKLVSLIMESKPIDISDTSIPPMALHIAGELYRVGVPLISDENGISIKDILPRLSNSHASLLMTALVVPNEGIAIENVGGLDRARIALRRWIVQQRFGVRSNYDDDGDSEEIDSDGEPDPVSEFHKFVHSGGGGQGDQRHGILLYGPPGCGKSMLIHAIANEYRKPMLVVTPSLIQRSYYGESSQQIKMLFEVAELIAPCIIVLDELDGMFRERRSSDFDYSREIKMEFIQRWEGVRSNDALGTGQNPNMDKTILFIGATNRPFDVDPAILRRLGNSFYIHPPSEEDRFEILKQWCYEERDLPILGKVLEVIAKITQDYTPSDLKRLIKTAISIGPLERNRRGESLPVTNWGPMYLTLEDVATAMEQVAPTPLSPYYIDALNRFSAKNRQTSIIPQENNGDTNGGGGPGTFSAENSVSPTPGWKWHNADSQTKPSHWETEFGNFYHVGQLQVDPNVLETITDLWNEMMETYSDADENEEEEFDDDDY